MEEQKPDDFYEEAALYFSGLKSRVIALLEVVFIFFCFILFMKGINWMLVFRISKLLPAWCMGLRPGFPLFGWQPVFPHVPHADRLLAKNFPKLGRGSIETYPRGCQH